MWPERDGVLQSCLVFQHIFTEADQAVRPPRPKATDPDSVSLCASEGIPLCFNSGAVLLCPARSVFVGRVAAAGSSGDGEESCTPGQRGV